MTKKRIHQIYGILLSVSLVVSGILLIIACIGIYLSGDRPFTPEAVAATFSGIAIPVYLCLGLIVGGFILEGFFPAERKKQQPKKQYGAILARLYGKIDLESCDTELRRQIKKQQNARKIHKSIALGLLTLGSIIFLCYGMNGANFDQQDITGSMIKAMYLFIPCLAVPFAYGVFTAYHRNISMQKEIALLKQINAPKPNVSKNQPADGKKLFLSVRWVLLGIAVGIMIFGFLTGGTNDVLTKAINICTECVGLG